MAAEGRAADPARRAAERGGRRAETIAALLLRAKLYRILARRYRTPAGEIDIVAKRGRAIVFVEVKNRPDEASGHDAVTPRSRSRIARAAHLWLAKNPWAAGHHLRIDLVIVMAGRLPRHVVHVFDWEGRP
jgi:putative endonuclease